MKELELKAAVRERDGQRCVDCGMTAEEYAERSRISLDVHRLSPGSQYTAAGTVTVCRSCHRVRHGAKKGHHLAVSIFVERGMSARVAAQAKRFSISRPGYLRMAVTERLERDEIESKVKRKPPADDAD